MENSDLSFPIIIKPNIGFKGYMVAKIRSWDELKAYLAKLDQREMLIQEFIDYDHEFSLLYYRSPQSMESGISSLIEKKYPHVTGDGQTPLADLIRKTKNPFLKRDWIFDKLGSGLSSVPGKGEVVVIDDVGNYSRGAKFYNLNDSIDQDLVQATDLFFRDIPGIDFCRLDFKAPSLEAYKNGEFKILEINGAKSEPLHIYDPDLSIFSVIRSIHTHWMILGRIVEERLAMAFKLPPFRHGLKSYVSVKKLMKS